MGIPQKETLERSNISFRNWENDGKREIRPETDSELAHRQSLHENFIKFWFQMRRDGLKSSAEARIPSTDWTQLLDSNLTDESVAAFQAYRENLRTITNGLLEDDNLTPVDENHTLWDEDTEIDTLIPAEPTPVYKSEE
jgi:hypothetical protein